MMKNVVFLLLSFATIFLTGCNEVEELNPNDLVSTEELNPEVEDTSTPSSQQIPKPEFDITAVIDGVIENFTSILPKATNLDIGEVSKVSFSARNEVTGNIIGITIDRNDLDLKSIPISITSDSRVELSNEVKLLGGTGILTTGGTLIIEQIDKIKGIVTGSFDINVQEIQSGSGTILKEYAINEGKFYFTYNLK